MSKAVSQHNGKFSHFLDKKVQWVTGKVDVTSSSVKAVIASTKQTQKQIQQQRSNDQDSLKKVVKL